MKKTLTAAITTALVIGAASTTFAAANPFTDVPTGHWSYDAVAKLAQDGVIEGYGDGTFRGDKAITRYEMAQMVAKAMANQDRANAEQQAMINRLADEFASELNNLGVRVAALENKVGNVKVTGDMRLRYRGSEESDNTLKNETKYAYKKHSKFDYRGRIQFNATVNEDTQAVVRLSSDSIEFGDSDTNGVMIDRAYVTHTFGDNVKVTAGRYQQAIGAGLLYDDTFDGANVKVGNEKVQLEAAYGYLIEGNSADYKFDKNTEDKNTEFTYVGLKGQVANNTTLGGFWGSFKGDIDDDVYGFNLNANFGKVWVGGEWTDMDDTKDAQAWVAGLGYGNYNMAKAGTWAAKVQYFDQESGAIIPSSTWNQAYYGKDVDAKGWMATAQYALQKNVGLAAYYGFNWETQKGADLGDFYRAELNYKF